VMGTNPFAWAVPGGEGEGGAVVLDFATSIVAEGKLNIARTDGRLVAPGIILDRDRQPTTDPNDFYAGGSLLPFGAHKGSGMSMLIEMSAALLSGMGASPASNYAGGNGTLLLALEVSWFADPAVFIAEVDDFCREAKTIGAGGSGSDILVPGEKELRTRKEREAGGIEVGDEVRRQITELASGLGVDVGRFELS